MVRSASVVWPNLVNRGKKANTKYIRMTFKLGFKNGKISSPDFVLDDLTIFPQSDLSIMAFQHSHFIDLILHITKEPLEKPRS